MGIRDRLKGLGVQVADLGLNAAETALHAAQERLQKAEPEPEHTPSPRTVEVLPPSWEFDGSPQEVEEFRKAAAIQVPEGTERRDPKAMFWDPFSVIEAIGFREKPTAITYGTLSAMVWKTPVIQAVIQTRLSQLSQFTRVQRDRHKTGFKVRSRNHKERMGPWAKREAERIEDMIWRCGNNPEMRGRDNFCTFTRKVFWDSLVYDQMCWETIPDRRGRPAEWLAVDAATIRLADTPEMFWRQDSKRPRTVQIYDNMIISEWPKEEMTFGVRNPRSNIRNHGYGTSELEMLVQAITSMLWAWQWNQKIFSQGSAAKGMINFKGIIPDRQMRAFRRHFYQMISGTENAWRTPITSAPDGIEWVDMQLSAKDMEYSAWMDFLIKVVCAVYLMDPIEVNFKYGNTGQRSMFEAANKQKLVESRDKGLKPLLHFYADQLNEYIVHPLNEDLAIDFLGIDAQTPQELAELNDKRVKTYMMVDEIREESDLDPLPDGKGQVILDPTWMQHDQAAMMMGGGAGNGGEMEPGSPGGPPAPSPPVQLPADFSDDDSTFRETTAASLAAIQEETAKSFSVTRRIENEDSVYEFTV